MQWSDRIGRRLKLQDLHTVMITAEEGAMGKAARRLNTAQPAISRVIADLEHELGVELFQRGPSGVTPTHYGVQLIECAKIVFAELRHGVKTLEALADPTNGEVRLGGTEPIVAGLVPVVFRRLLRRYPGISLRVEPSNMAAAHMALLRNRRVDFILSRLPGSVDEDMLAEQLYLERSFVVCGASSPWARRRKVRLDELIDEPWALPAPDTLTGSIFEASFRAKGLRYPSRNVAFGPVYLHLSLAASGQFLAILPNSLLHFSEMRVAFRVLSVEPPVPVWPVGIITQRHSALSPAAAEFIEVARKVSSVLQAAH